MNELDLFNMTASKLDLLYLAPAVKQGVDKKYRALAKLLEFESIFAHLRLSLVL